MGFLVVAAYGLTGLALADWRWLIVPLIVYVTFGILYYRDKPEVWEKAPVVPLLIMGASGLLCALLNRFIPEINLYYSYTLAWGVQLVSIGVLRNAGLEKKRIWLGPISVALRGWLILFFPFALVQQMEAIAVLSSCGAVAILLIAALVIEYSVKHCTGLFNRWLLQAVVAFGAAITGLFVQSAIFQYPMV